jgi:hypothetical protein
LPGPAPRTAPELGQAIRIAVLTKGVECGVAELLKVAEPASGALKGAEPLEEQWASPPFCRDAVNPACIEAPLAAVA